MSIADEIAKLQQLRDSGAITEEEFNRAKTAVLGANYAATAPQPLPDVTDRSPQPSQASLKIVHPGGWFASQLNAKISIDGAVIGAGRCADGLFLQTITTIGTHRLTLDEGFMGNKYSVDFRIPTAGAYELRLSSSWLKRLYIEAVAPLG